MKVILMFFLFFCLISHTMASVRVATVDMADLFENDPEIIALQKKVKAKQVKIKAENEKLLIEIRAKHAKIDAITRKIKNPQITKKERKDLLRERQLVSHSMPTDPTLYHRKLEAIQRAINVEIHMEMRKFLFRIEKETKLYAQENKIDLLLNKSLKGNHKRPLLVYATIDLDVTKQIQIGEKSSKPVGLELNKLNVATINLDQLLKQEKLERITEIVEVYAKKNGIHLVFDSSAESSTYSKVILSSRKAVDLTKLVSQKPESSIKLRDELEVEWVGYAQWISNRYEKKEGYGLFFQGHDFLFSGKLKKIPEHLYGQKIKLRGKLVRKQLPLFLVDPQKEKSIVSESWEGIENKGIPVPPGSDLKKLGSYYVIMNPVWESVEDEKTLKAVHDKLVASIKKICEDRWEVNIENGELEITSKEQIMGSNYGIASSPAHPYALHVCLSFKLVHPVTKQKRVKLNENLKLYQDQAPPRERRSKTIEYLPKNPAQYQLARRLFEIRRRIEDFPELTYGPYVLSEGSWNRGFAFDEDRKSQQLLKDMKEVYELFKVKLKLRAPNSNF